MDRIALAAPREVRYDLRLRPRTGRCRVSENGMGCSQVAETRGVCRHHYATLRSKPSLLDLIALPSAARAATVFERAQDVGDPVISCVVLENGVRCSGPPEVRGLCRRHHKVLGNHADYSLFDFYLPEREIVLQRKPSGETLDGLCVAVEDGRSCSLPPYVRGLCRHHQRLAARLGVLDALALQPRSRVGSCGRGNDRPHYYIDKNVLYDHADFRLFGTAGQNASVALVEEVRGGRVRASVSLDAVKSTYSHVRYRLMRVPEEGGRGLSAEDAESKARDYTRQTFYDGGAWRFVQLDAVAFSRVVTGQPGALSLEDAMEFQTYQQERVARSGPTLFVTRDMDFPEGVHPAHVVKALGERT